MALLLLLGAQRASFQFVVEPLDFVARSGELPADVVALARYLLEIMSGVRVQGREQVRPCFGSRQFLFRRRVRCLFGRHVSAPRCGQNLRRKRGAAAPSIPLNQTTCQSQRLWRVPPQPSKIGREASPAALLTSRTQHPEGLLRRHVDTKSVLG